MALNAKEETRKRNEEIILEAAEKAFAEFGYRGSSISMIANLAGVPKSNVVYYFSSKEVLYREVLDEICQLWLGAGDNIHKANDPATALKSYIIEKMELARTRPFGSKVWANEIIHGAPFISDYLENTLHGWVKRKGDVLSYWMDEGLMRRADPREVFYLIWSTTQHYADFKDQIEILNNNHAMNQQQWESAKQTVSETLVGGLLLSQNK